MARPDSRRWARRQITRGESYRWFKAFRCSCGGNYSDCPYNHDKNGYIYEEQIYCIDGVTLVSDVKALVFNTTKDMYDAEGNLFPKGTTGITVMPQWTPLIRPDRVLLNNPARLMWEQPLIERGAGDTDVVPIRFLVSVNWVRQGTIIYEREVDWQLTGNTIEWLGATRPDLGDDYVAEAAYHPYFEYNRVGEKPPRPDKFDTMMPQRGGVLTQIQPTLDVS